MVTPPLQKDYAPAEAKYGGGEKYVRQIYTLECAYSILYTGKFIC